VKDAKKGVKQGETYPRHIKNGGDLRQQAKNRKADTRETQGWQNNKTGEKESTGKGGKRKVKIGPKGVGGEVLSSLKLLKHERDDPNNTAKKGGGKEREGKKAKVKI